MKHYRSVTYSVLVAALGLAGGFSKPFQENVASVATMSAGFLSVGRSAAVEAQEPRSDQTLTARLWPKVHSQEKRDALIKSGRLRYIEGVPISANVGDLTSAHTSVAQALYYLDSQYGFIAARHLRREVPDQEVAAEVAGLESKLSGIGAKYGKDSIVAGLLSLSDENERQYSHFLGKAPESSAVGYLGLLYRHFAGKRADLRVSDVATALGSNLAKAYVYRVETRPVEKVTYEALAESLRGGRIPIVAGDSDESWATVVGYFVDDDGAKYIIVHEPRFANRDRKERLLGSLNHSSAPQGVNVYAANSLPYRSAIALGKPSVDPRLFFEFLKKQTQPTPTTTSTE